MAQPRVTGPTWAKQYSVATAGADLTLDEVKGVMDAAKLLGFDGKALVRVTATSGRVSSVDLLQPLPGADNQ